MGRPDGVGPGAGVAPAGGPPAAGPAPMDASESERDAVLALLSVTAVPVDELVRQSGLPPALVQMVLLELEIAGRIERHAGGRVSLG